MRAHSLFDVLHGLQVLYRIKSVSNTALSGELLDAILIFIAKTMIFGIVKDIDSKTRFN